jgi:hypothetical protein
MPTEYDGPWRRFRDVSRRYPVRVAQAYDGDLERAMADTLDQVAATVAAWETEHGIVPFDWPAIGVAERSGRWQPRFRQRPMQ